MSNVLTGSADADHRRATEDLKEALRDLRVQLAVLNHRIGGQAELRDVDLDCLDLISRHHLVNPSGLAKLAGLHPATLTGILDRLERGAWIVRERDASDRRAVAIRVLPDRNAEMFRLYAGMRDRMDELCAGYDEAQLELITDFLRRATTAGNAAAGELAAV